jgi:transposase
MSYIKGADRNQKVLFPPAMDDYIAEDSVTRFIDYFVDDLDLIEMGFERAEPEHTGRPGYDPRDMLKLYIYGYLNKVRSSRRLERECHRNVELMWLLRGLKPDFKTIADFRKNNRTAFKNVFRHFNLLCDGWALFGKKLLAIDGSKFKAVNSKDRNFTKARLQKKLAQIDKALKAFLKGLNDADKLEAGQKEPTIKELKSKIRGLKKRKKEYRELQKQLEDSGEKQISLTDPESRSMPKSPKVDVGYNIQVAVDDKHKLIVEHGVTNDVNDLNQLSGIAIAAQEALGVTKLDVVADRGYYNGSEVRACEDDGITPFIEKPNTSANKKLGLFAKSDFRYDPRKDVYVCPADQELTYRYSTEERGREISYYWTTACKSCPLRSKCTRGKQPRRITRWVDEKILEAMAVRVRRYPEILKRRKAIVEHPFGTMKHWWDQGCFLMKGLEKVGGEFSITALTYNIRRAVNILGVPAMVEGLG